MKFQNSPKIFALVTRRNGKNWFLIEENGEYKFADKFGAYCLYFVTKGQAKSYIREYLLDKGIKVIVKKITNIPKDQISVVAQEDMPKDACVLTVIGEDGERMFMHFDRTRNEYVIHPQREGSCVFSREQAEEMKDGMKLERNGMELEFEIKLIADWKDD